MLHPTLAPLGLSRLPTPLERLDAPSDRLGLDLWIKRDDLTGFGLSGNKVRKLDWLLAAAAQAGATTVLTTGGIQSNHCRATVVAARQVGLRPVVLLRGTAPCPDALSGNLLLDVLLGAEVHWCTPEEYQHRDARLEALAEGLRQRGEVPYVVPEGGSNAVGSLGFLAAAHEVQRQADGAFDQVWCAVGSGGTLAGLSLGFPDARVVGVAVCDDRKTFRERVVGIGAETHAWGHRLPDPGWREPQGTGWDVLEGHQGPAYAETTPTDLATMVAFMRETGIFLDPVYTGKAWCALEAEVRQGAVPRGTRVLFWHTGGAFGLFGRGAEVVAALGSSDPSRGAWTHRED